MKTGDILLVSGKGKQAKIIQAFQKKSDEASGEWNHSGVIYVGKSGIYVVEESYITGRKTKAAAVLTPLDEYLQGDSKMMILSPTYGINEARFESILFRYIGIPYDYKSLLWDQVIRTLFDKWRGSDEAKGWRRMVCHEFVQFIHNENYKGVFPEWYKGDIAKTFHSKYFHHELYRG